MLPLHVADSPCAECCICERDLRPLGDSGSSSEKARVCVGSHSNPLRVSCTPAVFNQYLSARLKCVSVFAVTERACVSVCAHVHVKPRDSSLARVSRRRMHTKRSAHCTHEVYTDAHIHTCMHACMHVYIHTHIHTAHELCLIHDHVLYIPRTNTISGVPVERCLIHCHALLLSESLSRVDLVLLCVIVVCCFVACCLLCVVVVCCLSPDL